MWFARHRPEPEGASDIGSIDPDHLREQLALEIVLELIGLADRSKGVALLSTAPTRMDSVHYDALRAEERIALSQTGYIKLLMPPATRSVDDALQALHQTLRQTRGEAR